MLCDANGVPLRFLLSGAQASDIAYAQPLLDEAYIPSLRGRPRKRCRWLLADKGYDAEALRRYCDRYRMQPVIPLRSMKRKPKPGLPRLFDRPKYRQRNIIERMFGWLKENRRIVTRFDKLATSLRRWSHWLALCGGCDSTFRTEPSNLPLVALSDSLYGPDQSSGAEPWAQRPSMHIRQELSSYSQEPCLQHVA